MKLTKYKYIEISDLHLVHKNPVCRIDNLVEVQWDKIGYIYEHAKNNDADVIISGDIHSISNNYSVLNLFSAFLYKYKNLGVNTFVVYGQHDLKYRNKEDTNLQIMINSGLINLIPNSGLAYSNNGIFFKIYGAGWMEGIPKIEDPNIMNILVIHAPISPVSLFNAQNYINAKSFIDSNGFDIVLCGDVHRTFIEESNGKVCLNSGPILRREAEEYSFIHKPGFWFINLKTIDIEFREIPAKTAEEALTREHINKLNKKKEGFEAASAAKFLYELKNRSGKSKIMKIDERMKAVILDDKNGLSKSAKNVIEILLNSNDLSAWLNSVEKIERVKA